MSGAPKRTTRVGLTSGIGDPANGLLTPFEVSKPYSARRAPKRCKSAKAENIQTTAGGFGTGGQ